MFALIVACGGGESSTGDGFSVATLTPQDPASVNPTPLGSGRLENFIYPIEGACLPTGDQLMPNAPREYRLGIHEGVDFYNVDNCVPIEAGTSVLAVADGVVSRIDHGYVPLTPTSLNDILANPTSEEALDAFRGRQVWIDHGNGIVTRYCHLQGVTGALQVGDPAPQGTIVGFVGETGTPESVSAPGAEVHLHLEVRIGDSYLGAGMEPAQVRAEYLKLFSQ